MILLPWAEEIRDLSFPAPESGVNMARSLVDSARRAVSSMALDSFVPGCCENPVLQKHYAAVQALALGEEQPEEVVDVLHPDAAALAEKAPILKAWRAAIDEVVPAGSADGAGTKRLLPLAADDDPMHPPRARRREEAPLVAPTTWEEMRVLVHSGEVDRLTVPALREWLRSQGITTSGKKGDLVARVKACI